MTTQFKKAVAVLDEVEEKLGGAGKIADLVERDDAVTALAAELAQLQDEVAKMKAKAQETDPDRVIYGKAMATKVLALVNRYAKVKDKVTEVGEATAAAAKPERSARAEAAAAAKHAEEQAAAEKLRLEAEAAAEAVRKEAEEREAAAKQRALHEKRKAEAVAKLAARKEAKKKAEQDAKAKAAEEVRLKEEGRAREKAALERRRREERALREAKLRATLQKRQEMTVAAAPPAAAGVTAAPPPESAWPAHPVASDAQAPPEGDEMTEEEAIAWAIQLSLIESEPAPKPPQQPEGQNG